MAEWIISHFPSHKIYVEAYGGAGSVLLCKKPSEVEIYNDIDDQIINVLRCIRDHPQQLAKYIAVLPYSRTEFYRARVILATPRNYSNQIRQAAYTIMKAHCGFGSSGLRENNTGFRGAFTSGSTETVKSNLRRWAEYPSRIKGYSLRFRKVLIENMDAIELIQKSDNPGTLIYLDPPYEFEQRTSKKNQYRHEMDHQDHQDLYTVLQDIKHAAIILSGYSGGTYDKLKWKSRTKKNMTLYGQDRQETIWLNPIAMQSQKQQQLAL